MRKPVSRALAWCAPRAKTRVTALLARSSRPCPYKSVTFPDNLPGSRRFPRSLIREEKTAQVLTLNILIISWRPGESTSPLFTPPPRAQLLYRFCSNKQHQRGGRVGWTCAMRYDKPRPLCIRGGGGGGGRFTQSKRSERGGGAVEGEADVQRERMHAPGLPRACRLTKLQYEMWKSR